ncbi:MAG: TetR family transcriptional regulator [Solirubrobacterales bacterium]|nr:TetR family transcriptional regulator [Solirubrobacterales bacterium]
MPIVSEPGLRARKKAKTRATIVRVALDLFAEQGYSQTTIAQVAEAADVSPRTVSTYFPAKEDIVFDVSSGSKERLVEAIQRRPEGQDTMAALKEWLLEERQVLDHDRDLHACQRLVIDREESLLQHEQALFREFELVLAEGLAQDLDLPPSDPKPRMAAAAAMAAFDLIHDEGHAERHEGQIPTIEEQLDLLDQALAFINGGVSALRQGRKGP